MGKGKRRGNGRKVQCRCPDSRLLWITCKILLPRSSGNTLKSKIISDPVACQQAMLCSSQLITAGIPVTLNNIFALMTLKIIDSWLFHLTFYFMLDNTIIVIKIILTSYFYFQCSYSTI